MVGLGPGLTPLRLLRKKNTSAPKTIKPPTTPPAIPPIAPEERPDDELVGVGAAAPLVVLDEEVGEGLDDENVLADVVGGSIVEDGDVDAVDGAVVAVVGLF
jgi:hypothetical protein